MNSLQTYTDKYDKGYGLCFADGHIVRFYERILKYRLGKTSGNLLDFGCGNGVHSAFLKTKGFVPYGLDIVPSVKESYEMMTGGGACHIIKPAASFKHLFECKFDLIIANQSLYYLGFDDFKRTINELFELCNENAIIFATMMSEENYYFRSALKPDKQGLQEVRLQGRLNETSFIRFIKEAKQLKSEFYPFETLLLGDYDPINFYDFEGSAKHFIFVGVKK